MALVLNLGLTPLCRHFCKCLHINKMLKNSLIYKLFHTFSSLNKFIFICHQSYRETFCGTCQLYSESPLLCMRTANDLRMYSRYSPFSDIRFQKNLQSLYLIRRLFKYVHTIYSIFFHCTYLFCHGIEREKHLSSMRKFPYT